jgi:peptidoglycan/xylan/chitin deacetylase (PgdA/CDA1 family)
VRLRKTLVALPIALGILLSVSSFASAAVPHAATPPRGIPVLMYHQLAPKDVSLRARHNVLVTPEVFEAQLQYLKKSGYTTITCSDLADYLIDKKPLPTRPILLTFDDGWRSNYLYAFPLLKKYEMKATIFLITAMMGYREELSDPVQNKAGLGVYMVWSEITEMADSGLISFESHTNNLHFANKNRTYGMDAVSKEYLEEDLLLASEKIEKATGHRPVALAYPYGHYKKAYKEPLEKAGIRIAFTTREGEVNAADNPLELNRITIYPFHKDLSRVLRGRQLRISRF